jgi:hypothetical protein
MKKLLLGLSALLPGAISLSQPTVLDRADLDNATGRISIPEGDALEGILNSFPLIVENSTIAVILLDQLSGKELLPIVVVSMVQVVIGDYVDGLKKENPGASFRELLMLKSSLIERLLKDRPACLSQLRRCGILSPAQQ